MIWGYPPIFSISVRLSRSWVKSVTLTKMRSEKNMNLSSQIIRKGKLPKNSFWKPWGQVNYLVLYSYYTSSKCIFYPCNIRLFSESSCGRVSVSSVWWRQQRGSKLFWIFAGRHGQDLSGLTFDWSRYWV